MSPSGVRNKMSQGKRFERSCLRNQGMTGLEVPLVHLRDNDSQLIYNYLKD